MKPDRIILRRERQSSPRMPGGWSRESLRILARRFNVPRGKDTMDTVNNLANAGHMCRHCFQIIPKETTP